jgi:hypothetical protein
VVFNQNKALTSSKAYTRVLHFVMLQVQVTVQNLDEKLSGGLQDIEGS